MIVEDLVKVAIDAYLLSKLEGDELLGEVLEFLTLSNKRKMDDTHVNRSLIYQKAKQYLKSQFMSGPGMNVAKLIQLGEAVLSSLISQWRIFWTPTTKLLVSNILSTRRWFHLS